MAQLPSQLLIHDLRCKFVRCDGFEGCDVYLLYRLVAAPEAAAEMAKRLSAGGYGYGDAKKALLAAIEERFGPARERRTELAADPGFVDDVLADGGRRARAVAQETMAGVREAVGLAGRPVGS